MQLLYSSLLFLFFVCHIDKSWGMAQMGSLNWGACNDYPTCKLVSAQMFDKYCDRSTLKSMCPTYCKEECKPLRDALEEEKLISVNIDTDAIEKVAVDPATTTTPTTSTTTTTEPTRTTTTTTTTTATTTTSTTTTTTTTTTTSTTTTATATTTTSTTSTTTPTTTTTTTTSTTTTSTTTRSTTTTTTRAEVLPTVRTNPENNRAKFQIYLPKKQVTMLPPLTFPPTTTEAARGTAPEIILIPLISAGFFREIKATSNRQECNIFRPSVCKQDVCQDHNLWCPASNDVPKEQIEVLFNFTTDVYLLETQGMVSSNETIVHFLFQYLDDTKTLISQIFRTATKSSSIINKFVFDPPIKTNYFRITPIEYEVAMALRFEVYSKGILYKPVNA